MLIYSSTKKQFMEDIDTESFMSKLKGEYYNKIGGINPSEETSWKNSITNYMYKVLNSSEVPNSAGIAIEFKVPLTSKRIDFMISGYDENNNGNVIIIELKQWSSATRTENMDGVIKVNTFVGGSNRNVTHPSYQAWSYKTLIEDFNQATQNNLINLIPCAYLHNYNPINRSELDNENYKVYVDKAPLYLEGDALKLREFILRNLRKGDNGKNLYEIDHGKLKPSKSLQDLIQGMLSGNSEFVMIDNQKVIYESALLFGKVSNADNKKRVLIIEGGPGTGKTVVAINLLDKYLNAGFVSQYVSKNAAPRNVYMKKLKSGKFKKEGMRIEHLFRGSGVYINAPQNELDVLIVDEAHRLNSKSGMFKNLGENQIKEIINASKCSIFFIDENQKVDISDIGTKAEIEKYAKTFDAEIYNFKLESQFRCNGSDGYLSWLNNILQIKETANAEGFDFDFDFQIFDSPIELKKAIEEKNNINNKARLVAGYCWDWISSGKNDSNIFDINIEEYNFHMSWNLGNSTTWAIDKESINEVGCIHTCQGLEFDYVGVIIGDDLKVVDGICKTNFLKRAKTDKSLSGIKKKYKENPHKALEIADEIIKNTYRTLMTRGQKGCYIFCTDKQLSNYFKAHLPKINKNHINEYSINDEQTPSSVVAEENTEYKKTKK